MIVCVIIYAAVLVWMILRKKEKIPILFCEKVEQEIWLVLLCVNTLALFLFLADAENSQLNEGRMVERNSYGEGKRTEKLKVTIPGELSDEIVEVDIPEKQYTKAEIKRVFQRAMRNLDTLILGENKTLDHVEYDLNLITQLEREPVDISWEIDNYQVINIYGELQEKNLKEEGTLIELRGTLSYLDEEAQYVTNAMVYPRAKNGKEKWVVRIKEQIQKNDEKSASEDYLQLPEEIEGKAIVWSVKKDERGYVILALGGIAVIFLILLYRQNIEKEKQEKRQQMLRDYPEIISKFTLLLGAGMTIKNAWKKIVQDYEKRKQVTGVRYAYEEMCCTYHEMQGGLTEIESYERFSKRIELQPYLKLGALLVQNLKKGTKELSRLLEMEAVQAFEERKNAAKKLGEEASTKLLAPMFLMLVVVLVIVIIPAFLSIGM